MFTQNMIAWIFGATTANSLEKMFHSFYSAPDDVASLFPVRMQSRDVGEGFRSSCLLSFLNDVIEPNYLPKRLQAQRSSKIYPSPFRNILTKGHGIVKQFGRTVVL